MSPNGTPRKNPLEFHSDRNDQKPTELTADIGLSISSETSNLSEQQLSEPLTPRTKRIATDMMRTTPSKLFCSSSSPRIPSTPHAPSNSIGKCLFYSMFPKMFSIQ